MRRLAILAVLLVAGTLHADEPDQPDETDDGTLVPHAATARLTGRVVHIDARFAFAVDGPLPRGTVEQIALPHGAVITGATVQANGHTQRLRLATMAAVDRSFETIYERSGHGSARRWAVRVDAASDRATVEIAAAREARVELELTIEVPACFANDARGIVLPPRWRRAINAAGAVSQAEPCAQAMEQLTDDSQWLAFPATELARRTGGEQRIGIQASRLPLASKHLARVEIALAKQLTDIPPDLHTVLVVDHSRSMTTGELDAQRAVVAAYLRAAPQGRVQVVSYARDTRLLLPGWMPAARAGSRIERELRSLAPRNGSDVGRAIATAATILAQAQGTRRLILFTDDHVSRRTLEDLATFPDLLSAGTLVHVVALEPAATRVARSDHARLAWLAQATQGMAVTAGFGDEGGIDALSLVRPISLDHLAITSKGPAVSWDVLSEGDGQCVEGNEDFHEGTSCGWLAQGEATAADVVVEGFLWGRKFSRTVTPDRRDARPLARLLSTLSDLPTELVSQIERAAVAVNNSWALFATWGASGGYGDLDGCCGIGSSSFDSSRHGFGGRGSSGVTFSHNLDALLRAQLAAAVRACKPRGAIHVTVELTKEEIVEVAVAVRDAADVTLDTCIAEGIWDTSLVLPDPPGHATVRVEFPPH